MRRVKGICIMLSVMALLPLFGGMSVVEASTPADWFSGGSGTMANPYQIRNVYELQNITNLLTANYALMNNIDASITSGWNGGDGFLPIGNLSDPFIGTFDGDGYTISYLYINRSATEYVGLFGYVENTTISFIHIDGNITGENYVGGLIGYGYNLTLHNSSATTTTTGKNYVGGLIGGVHGESLLEQNKAGYNTTGHNRVGGYVGVVYGDDVTIQDSYTQGNITGGEKDTGGFVGYIYNGTIQNCYSSSNVTGESGSLETAEYKQDFDDETIGDAPSGWVIDGSLGGGTWTVQADPDRAGNSFEGVVTSPIGFIRRGISPTVAEEYFTTTVRPTRNDRRSFLMLQKDDADLVGTKCIMSIFFYENGNIQIFTGGSRVDTGFSYTGGTRYQIEVYIDWTAKEKEVFVDGVSIGTYAFRDASATAIGSIHVGISDVSGGDTVYWDDVQLGSHQNAFVGGGNATFSNNFYDNQTTQRETDIGATGKTTVEMQTLSTFNDTATVGLTTAWSIAHMENHTTETWYIDEGNDYPRLGWEDKPVETVEIWASINTITVGQVITFSAWANDTYGNIITDDVSLFTWTNATNGVFNEEIVGEYNVSATYGGVTSNFTVVTVEAPPPPTPHERMTRGIMSVRPILYAGITIMVVMHVFLFILGMFEKKSKFF